MAFECIAQGQPSPDISWYVNWKYTGWCFILTFVIVKWIFIICLINMDEFPHLLVHLAYKSGCNLITFTILLIKMDKYSQWMIMNIPSCILIVYITHFSWFPISHVYYQQWTECYSSLQYSTHKKDKSKWQWESFICYYF